MVATTRTHDAIRILSELEQQPNARLLLQRIQQSAAGRATCASTATACRTPPRAVSSNVPLGRRELWCRRLRSAAAP
jgi:hypothetical protein